MGLYVLYIFYVDIATYFLKMRIIIDALLRAGAWIITGGTSVGVMRYVGEAVADYQQSFRKELSPIVCLGIATWGTLDNKKCMIGPEVSAIISQQILIKYTEV